MRTIFTLFIGLLIAVSTNGQSSDKYNEIYELLKFLPSQKLITDGDEYYEKQVLDSALICYTLVSSRYTKEMPAPHKRLCAHAYHYSGNIHYVMYNYVQAQTMYFKALEICQESGDSLQLPRIYNNLGKVYAVFGDFKKGRDYYTKAYDGARSSSDKELKIKILNNLLGLYSNVRDSENLEYYLDLCEQLQKEDSVKSIFNYLAKGWISQLKGNPRQAVKYQKQALWLADSLKLPPQYACSALNNISEAFSDMQRYDSVEYYLKKCADIAIQEGLLDVQGNVYRELSEIYSNRNDIKSFFHYSKLYQQINDSIRSMQGYRSISNIEFLFEVNRLNRFITGMQTEQMLKEVRLKNQQQIMNVILVAFFIAVSLLIAVYLQKRKLQHSYREIFMRNKEIIESEKQAKEHYKVFQNEIQKKDLEIAQLQGEIRQTLPANEEYVSDNMVDDDDITEDMPAKYQGSSLTKEQKDRLLSSINKLMDTTLEFCNPDFTLERMAALTKSRPKYVSQVINETYGKNFNRYVNEYRIKEARLRLTDITNYGNYTVKAIAQSVGFRSNSNFNTLFKELTGITPSMYQEMANS